MKERVVEILVYLMSEIEANKRLSEINLEDLADKGYTQSEISAAFSWLYDNLPVQDGHIVLQTKSSEESRRQLHDAEKMVLTTEAQGYLMQLCELRLLDNFDLETVLERAMMLGLERLSMDDMREIVAVVLSAKTTQGRAGRSMFNSNDMIH